MDDNDLSLPREELSKADMTAPALGKKVRTTSVDSSFPVLLPEDPCLRMSQEEFEAAILKTLPNFIGIESEMGVLDILDDDSSFPMFSHDKTGADPKTIQMTQPSTTGNTFVDVLNRAAANPTGEQADATEMARRNRMLTENMGMAYASTQSPILELFNKVDHKGNYYVNNQQPLAETLEEAWKADPLMTLKVIWMVRSIHLGKGDKGMFYRQLGWLKEKHPRTLLMNLKWLHRAVIKKDAKRREGDDHVIFDKVNMGGVEGERTQVEVDDFDVLHGVSHGYWKDLLNILVLSSQERLDMSDPDEVLLRDCRVRKEQHDGMRQRRNRSRTHLRGAVRGKMRGGARGRNRLAREQPTPAQRQERKKCAVELVKQQKAASKEEKARRHAHILNRLARDPFHRALHLTVARLFADQLRKDKLLLESGNKDNKESLRGLSLCAKWAPSLEHFHDKHTLIATTIAELLFPSSALEDYSQLTDPRSRDTYLKYAREHYRAKILSPLRKALSIVERDISAQTFSNIQYSHVPSIAMNKYRELFSTKDSDRFHAYLQDVALGKVTISGAILTPGSLIKQVLGLVNHTGQDAVTYATVLDLQWKTMVQRIKDSGTLSNSMAVCDVSGSMNGPADRLGICPLDHAIGLSLLIAEVTKPPFGGRIITFSQNPQIQVVGGEADGRSLKDKVQYVQRANWGWNTDFIEVFRQVILPLAVENKVPPEDMVKRVFVFSDMQFDQAQGDGMHGFMTPVFGVPGSGPEVNRWQTHHQFVEMEFQKHGYEVPELVYWNLAGRAGAVPVTHDMKGTALVSGQSQALMKAFLDCGVFEEEEIEAMEGDGQGDDSLGENQKKKTRFDPLKIVRKAVGHAGFDMLRVVD
ncbi:uncharacterized protein PADG_04261 [Paracoccidioides brasiliensis Pb18]|uniref:DUF2828 domain-containing protein n=1 Tax=Paracoccidioides brasiliensis (strain Pb18) TaxID=502780 RepID=C1GAH5_PARBD|nr:uncharacterized protein PADG_04261 [Paracoccidioides brasiliensis Pb18]EEH48177.1 hypothetical protein PADG_04261 [Paracoccidioides brasiliensis Pb18]